MEDKYEIVIIGGGVAGFATALALHRKGIKSVVLERSESVRVTGVNITIYTNGWRALEQLGVASRLRPTAIPLHSRRDISIDDKHESRTPSGKEEIRCLRRRDLVETIANELPAGAIEFGVHVVAIKSDPNTSYPTLELRDGRLIKPKIVIGCDGVNSVVSKYLGLKPPAFHSVGSFRGFTKYEGGHGWDSEFVETRKGKVVIGKAPVTESLVCWFIARIWQPEDEHVSKDPILMQQSALEAVKDFPSEMAEMVSRCDTNSLSLSRIRHRSLYDVALNRFRKGNVVVAGDAMHVMGPYFGQGGCSALEDGVVLGRCIAREMRVVSPKGLVFMDWGRASVAFGEFVRERRPRLVLLSLRATLIGKIVEPSTSVFVRFVCIVLMVLFFRDVNGPAQYDCGKL